MFCVLKNVFNKDIDKQAGFCYTAPKTIFFSKCFEKMIFPNKYAGISCFLYYHKRQYLFFWKYNFSFQKENCRLFSPKIWLKHNIFFMILTHYLVIIWKTKSSSKKALKDDVSFIIGWVDTFPKNMVLLWVRQHNMI